MDCVENRNFLVDPNHLALYPEGSSKACIDGYRDSHAIRRVFATVLINDHVRAHGDMFGRYFESRWRFFSDLPYLQADLIWNLVCSAFWGVASLFTLFQNESFKHETKKCLYKMRLSAGSLADAVYGVLAPEKVARRFLSDYGKGVGRLNQVNQAGHGWHAPVSVDPNHTALSMIGEPEIVERAARYSDTLRSTFAVVELNQYDYQQKGRWFTKQVVTRGRFVQNGLLAYARLSWTMNKIFILSMLSLMTFFLVDAIKNRLTMACCELTTLGRCAGDSLLGALSPKRVTARFVNDFYTGCGRLSQIKNT